MICRLCLKDITEVINIFNEIGIELNVAEVLAKYFWFEPKKDDPISTAICNECWIKVSNFHEFYSSVEEAHRLLTERFCVNNESRKSRNRNSQKKEERHIKSRTTYKNEPTDEADSTVLNLDVSLANNGEDAAADVDNISSPILYKKNHSENHVDIDDDSDSDSVDGEILMESLFEADEEHDVLELEQLKPSIATVNRHNLRRSTRSNPLLSSTDATTIQENIEESAKTAKQNLDDSKETALVKKRRGRPPNKSKSKNTISCVKRQKGNKDVAGKHDDDGDDVMVSRKANYEAKMREIDDRIKQYMNLCCDVCATEQTTFAQLRKHMEVEHNCKGYAVCCGKKFYKRILLADHIEKHLNPDCYKCNECDKVFAEKQCMRNHFLLKHQPDEVKTFKCNRCPKKFAKPYLLEQHRVVHEARTHICNLCNKGFASNTLLGTHKKLKHTNYGTMCDICAKVIRGRAAFAKHQLEHTGVVLPKVQCNICGSWHKNKYSLQKHKRRHNEEGIPHVCNLCNKVAPNRSALLSHQRYVHASHRTFECSVCKKAFKKALNLKEHMAMHTGEVLYKCPHCTKTFNSNANMHSHRKKVHPKEFEEARKNRRENVTKDENQEIKTEKTDASGESATTDDVSELITIKTGDDGETHSILVTTTTATDFGNQINIEDADNDDDCSVDNDDDCNSIIFTVN